MDFRQGLPGVRNVLLPALFVGLASCSKPDVVVRTPLDRSHENLLKLGAAYTRFNSKYNKAPKNLDELKPFLQELGRPDELLRSPRDGEPYVICWGVDLLVPPKWARSTPVLAYERQGMGGQRYILTTLRSVFRMTDEEFDRASFPPGHQRPR
jgi:hypothetical protein